MKKKSMRILVVDDDTAHRSMLLLLLQDWGYTVAGAGDGVQAVKMCRENPFDLVLMDVRMPKMSGMEALQAIQAYNPAIPVLIMTAHSNVEAAVEAIKAGAYDYLTKPLDFEKLKITLANMFQYTRLLAENKQLQHTLASALPQTNIIGQSAPMRELMEMVATIAPSEATVLITGESGTGKELIAKAIHEQSERRSGPYVAINCAALAETLLESELFGHEKGAFTGADRRREGRFLAASKGTIFLDEIGEMPLAMQAKLLRVIQEREVQRVGGDQVLSVDVRIIAATNRILADEVAAGRFREDLYYRLNVVSLSLPPLREREGDIPLLAQFFAAKFAEKNHKKVKGFTPSALDKLVKYSWPGNVRELENIIERAVVLLLGELISDRELPLHLLKLADMEAEKELGLGSMTLEEVERVAIVEALAGADGNKSEAARRLGITRKTLHAKLTKYSISEE